MAQQRVAWFNNTVVNSDDTTISCTLLSMIICCCSAFCPVETFYLYIKWTDINQSSGSHCSLTHMILDVKWVLLLVSPELVCYVTWIQFDSSAFINNLHVSPSLLPPGAAEAKCQRWRGREWCRNSSPWDWQPVRDLGDRTAYWWQVNTTFPISTSIHHKSELSTARNHDCQQQTCYNSMRSWFWPSSTEQMIVSVHSHWRDGAGKHSNIENFIQSSNVLIMYVSLLFYTIEVCLLKKAAWIQGLILTAISNKLLILGTTCI